MDTTTSPTDRRRRAATVPALPFVTVLAAFGPTWTVFALLAVVRDGVYLNADLFPGAALGALIGLWAPHPASLVSLATQTARDATLRGRPAAVRALLLVPALLVRPGTRLVTAAQLVGLAVGLAVWASAAG